MRRFDSHTRELFRRIDGSGISARKQYFRSPSRQLEQRGGLVSPSGLRIGSLSATEKYRIRGSMLFSHADDRSRPTDRLSPVLLTSTQHPLSYPRSVVGAAISRVSRAQRILANAQFARDFELPVSRGIFRKDLHSHHSFSTLLLPPLPAPQNFLQILSRNKFRQIQP